MLWEMWRLVLILQSRKDNYRLQQKISLFATFQVCEEEKLNTWKESCDRVKSIVKDSGADDEDDAEVLDAVMEEERSGSKATEKIDSVEEQAEDDEEDEADDASTDSDEDFVADSVEEPELEKSIAKSEPK